MSIERSVFKLDMLSMMEWLATHCKSSSLPNDLRRLALFMLMLDKVKKCFIESIGTAFCIFDRTTRL